MDVHQAEQLVRQYETEAVDLLKLLITCDTTDYKEANGQIHVEKFFEKLEIPAVRIYPDADKLGKYECFNYGHTYENRYCIEAVWRGSGGGRSLLLNGHMDTVFPASPDEWRTDPFTPVIKDGKIYGLGSADMKSGLCALMMAVKILKESGIHLKGDIILQSVVDEEAGGGNGSLACIDAGTRADACLVAEPHMLAPASAHLGSAAYWLTAEGISAHANMKFKGVSAFEKLLPIINALALLEKKWEKRTCDLLPHPVITVLKIEAGDGSITLPGECRILVNYTYLPDVYDYHGEFMNVIDQCVKSDTWFQKHPLKIEKHHDCGPYYTDPKSEWPQAAAKAAGECAGREVEISGLPCGADARLYANIGNIPTVILGPGSIEQAHRPNEYVEIEQYLGAIKIYLLLLCEWCG